MSGGKQNNPRPLYPRPLPRDMRFELIWVPSTVSGLRDDVIDKGGSDRSAYTRAYTAPVPTQCRFPVKWVPIYSRDSAGPRHPSRDPRLTQK